MNKKILINVISARNGGGITYIKNILPFIAQYKGKNQITVLMSRDNADLESILNIPNIDFIKVNIPSENLLTRGFFEIYKIPKIMNRFKYDILFSPGGTSLTMRSKKFQTVTMHRNTWPHFHSNTFLKGLKNIFFEPITFFKLKILKRIIILNCRYQDKTIYISKYGKSLINKKVNIDNKSTVIKHAINENFFEYKKLDPKFKLTHKKYALYVSSFLPYKNHKYLLESFAKVKNEYDGYPLVLIGKILPKYKKFLDLEITRLGLEGRVFIYKEVDADSLASLYQNAFFNIFLSSSENCPNTMLEAIASGRPLLSSSMQPMPEFGKDFVTYCDPTNIENISEKLIFMKENIIHLENKSSRSVQTIIDKKGWKNVSIKTLDFILE